MLTLHDLTPLEHAEWFKPAYAAWYRWFLPRLVRRVRRIITPSEYVRQKVLSRFHLPGERVVVVPGGVDTTRFHKVAPAADEGRGKCGGTRGEQGAAGKRCVRHGFRDSVQARLICALEAIASSGSRKPMAEPCAGPVGFSV